MAIKVSGTTVIDNNRNATVNTLNMGGTDVIATAAEINYLSGVTSSIQTQLASISVTAGSLTKSFLSNETASIALSSALSPTPVVSATKEVPQVGISSKGAWDVATTGDNYIRLDSAYDTTITPFDTYWDISTAVFSQSFSIAAQETQPTGIFFKPDGTKMYVIGYTGDNVNEYDLSTAWDVSTAVFLQSFSVAAFETVPSDVFFKPDGTKMYVAGLNSAIVNEYDLSTAWDVSTASRLQGRLFSAQDGNIGGISFKSDGTKIYIAGDAGDSVYEYDLSTAWDITTTSFLQSFSVAAQETTPTGIFFKPDGTKMYISGSAVPKDLNEYDLSTPWDISTASFLQVRVVSGQDSNPQALFFKPDGSKLYVAGAGNDSVYEYNLKRFTSLTLGTGSFASTDVGKTIEGNGGEAILANVDGSYYEVTAFTDESTIASGNWSMYATKFDGTKGVTSSGVSVDLWDVSTAVFSQSFSVAAQDTSPFDIFFKPDGTKLYVLGFTGDDVNEYDLSTAWDVSTASFLQSFSVAAREATPHGLFFKPDGTKMYISGNTGDDITEYNLSTAWDVSTASYGFQFSVAAQEITPTGISFKPDGTKMYVLGSAGDDVNEYNLSAAWSVSSSVFSQSFSIAAQETFPNGLFFKPDGTKMYVVGSGFDYVSEYNLSTAWDVSTASYLQSFSVATQDTVPYGISFKPDGTKMYVLGNAGQDINEYDIGQLYVVTDQYSSVITNAFGQIDSTFWLDINSMTTDETAGAGAAYYAVSTDNRTTWSVINEADGVRPIVRNNAGTWEYNSNATYTLTTWTSATTNAELPALQQALTDVSVNRMAKTQLEAVTDPNHYTLGTSLDLMIGLYLGSASPDVPSSDGVSINYDAEVINKGAILGTDYDYDFPNSTTVRVTSLATQNLKVRVV